MESILHMDSDLYIAAITGDISVLARYNYQIGVQLTPDKKTVLHLASQLGQTEAVKLILSMHPSLISEVNLSGETALHLAARGGHARVVHVLLDGARKSDDDIESVPRSWQLLLRANDDGETALHDAARYNRREVLSMLLNEDLSYLHSATTSSHPLCNPCNKIGETPLYIAANRGFHELVDVILNNCEAPAYSGPNGTTALHGAVLCGSEECARKLSEWKKTIVKETDSNGQTPLHYAAYFGFSSIASQLLRVDPSTAYIVAKDNSETALHMAAIRGDVSLMKEILLACPDSCSMVDVHRQNMLHLAIENNQINVVEYILEECPVISSLINQKDTDGNTPSHLLALSNCNIPKFIQHDMVDKGALNNQNMTHLGSDLKPKSLLGAKYLRSHKNTRNTKTETRMEKATKSYGGTVDVHDTMNKESPKFMNKENPAQAPALAPETGAAPDRTGEEKKIEILRKANGTGMLVCVLVVTIAFAAGFTMPGGYIQSGSENQGMAVLTKSVAFRAFIISDTLALVLSIIALLVYGFAAGDCNDNTVTKAYYVGSVLVLLALLAIMIAFVSGTYAVLAHLSAFAIVNCVIGCTFFPMFLIAHIIFR